MNTLNTLNTLKTLNTGVWGGGGGGRREARGAIGLPVFGNSVNPMPTSGVDYTHHITTGPPDF